MKAPKLRNPTESSTSGMVLRRIINGSNYLFIRINTVQQDLTLLFSPHRLRLFHSSSIAPLAALSISTSFQDLRPRPL